MNVFVLASCRKLDLLPYTTLVFSSIRTGFPTANVCVCINAMPEEAKRMVTTCANTVDATVQYVDTIHHKYIEVLVQTQNEPFFILDTDVILYENFEQFEFVGSLAGWRIPEWRDDFSGCITRARIHTSLMYFDPVKVREQIRRYESGIADTVFTPKANLFYPLVVPVKGQRFFYDTCSMLYQAIGGQGFTDEQKSCVCHMNFGTIPDVVLPRLPAPEALSMINRRNQIVSNPELGRGVWREQESYYLSKPV